MDLAVSKPVGEGKNGSALQWAHKRLSVMLAEGDLHTVGMTLKKETDIDTLHGSLDELEGDRLTVAKKSRNEKLARLKTGDRVVMVASVSG